MASIKRVGSVIERAYGADALTVACQVVIYLSTSCLFAIAERTKSRMAKQPVKVFLMSTSMFSLEN
jgi:hypothetical protein